MACLEANQLENRKSAAFRLIERLWAWLKSGDWGRLGDRRAGQSGEDENQGCIGGAQVGV